MTWQKSLCGLRAFPQEGVKYDNKALVCDLAHFVCVRARVRHFCVFVRACERIRKTEARDKEGLCFQAPECMCLGFRGKQNKINSPESTEKLL